jgi:hypothetical protein
MKAILKFIRGVFSAFVYFMLGVAIMYATVVVITSGYEYRLVDGQPKRAWMVRLPGYQDYLDLQSTPLVHRSRFVMRAYYRVGPWYDPEPAIREEPECKP